MSQTLREQRDFAWATGNLELSLETTPEYDSRRHRNMPSLQVTGVRVSCADLALLLDKVPRFPGNPSDAKPPNTSKHGRPSAHWWPYFAEELAVYIHDKGLPEGKDAEGMEKVIKAISERLTQAGREDPARSSVQPVVGAVLRRIRTAGK